jgi:hypothetical protein
MELGNFEYGNELSDSLELEHPWQAKLLSTEGQTVYLAIVYKQNYATLTILTW